MTPNENTFAGPDASMRETGWRRWLKFLSEWDANSRLQLSMFGRQVAFIALFSAPALFVDQHRPVLFFEMMQEMFGLSGLLILCAAIALRRPSRLKGLCIWDHFATMLMLTLVCSIVLRLLPRA